MFAEFTEVGFVHSIIQYPVKSMRGHSMPQAELYWHGLEGDRRYAFVRGDNQSGFPWLTGRQLPQLLLYTPRLADPGRVRESPIEVETPDGRFLSLESAELRRELAQAYGHDVSLLKINRGIFDSQTLSLISTATAEAIGRESGTAVTPMRFRQNIIIETFSGMPYQEEAWLDGVLTFGDQPDAARIRLNRRIVRCVMINIDPETAEKAPQVLKTVAQKRDECAGVYASTERPGLIHVGDVIRLM